MRSFCEMRTREVALKGYEGADVHKDEEQYQDYEHHHHKVGPAHIYLSTRMLCCAILSLGRAGFQCSQDETSGT